MQIAEFNEADVREEIAAPLLAALGYSRGSDNDVLREYDLKLTYPKIFLGRKKPENDPVLRGRADYILRVVGVCRWVLEVKSPDQPLDTDSIEQALSYGRHPEISAELVGLLNGREFKLFRVNQTAAEPALIHLTDCRPALLASRLANVLSPSALRRDIRGHPVDLGRSLGGELRSAEEIIGGSIKYRHFSVQVTECPFGMREALESNLRDNFPLAPGMQNSVDSGRIERSPHGVIFARIKWNSPYAQIAQMMESKDLFRFRYVCLDDEISIDSQDPSVFDRFLEMNIDEGEEIFDMSSRETSVATSPATIDAYGQALGWLDGRVFKGEFQSETYFRGSILAMPFTMVMRAIGDFQIRLAP